MAKQLSSYKLQKLLHKHGIKNGIVILQGALASRHFSWSLHSVKHTVFAVKYTLFAVKYTVNRPAFLT
jgi:hypothetical protein